MSDGRQIGVKHLEEAGRGLTAGDGMGLGVEKDLGSRRCWIGVG